jgi:hypothetical protein
MMRGDGMIESGMGQAGAGDRPLHPQACRGRDDGIGRIRDLRENRGAPPGERPAACRVAGNDGAQPGFVLPRQPDRPVSAHRHPHSCQRLAGIVVPKPVKRVAQPPVDRASSQRGTPDSARRRGRLRPFPVEQVRRLGGTSRLTQRAGQGARPLGQAAVGTDHQHGWAHQPPAARIAASPSR